MIESILTASGVPYKQTRFAKPPAGSYAVYSDQIQTDGPDGLPGMIYRHSPTVVLYAPKQIDPAAEAAIEEAIAAHGLHYEKEGPEWDDQAQRYETIYEFSYTEKRRATK